MITVVPRTISGVDQKPDRPAGSPVSDTPALDAFDEVFVGAVSVGVRAREYHKIPGSSDTRSKYDEI